MYWAYKKTKLTFSIASGSIPPPYAQDEKIQKQMDVEVSNPTLNPKPLGLNCISSHFSRF